MPFKKRTGTKIKSVKGIQRINRGLYRIRICRRNLNGEQVWRDQRIKCSDLEEAKRIRQDWINEIVSSKEKTTRTYTLKGYAQDWLKRQKGRIAKGTYDKYRYAIQRLDELGGKKSIRLDKLTKRKIENYQNKLKASGLKANTVNDTISTLRRILADATDNNLVPKNVALNVRGFKTTDTKITKSDPLVLDPEELKEFLHYTKKLYPQHYALVALLFETGLRPGAVVALEWKDLKADTLYVRRRYDGHSILAGTKNNEEEVKYLSPKMVKLLKAHREELKSKPFKNTLNLMFPSETADYRSKGSLLKPFKKISEAMGLSFSFTPKGCRRTLNTILHDVGIPKEQVMRIIGHRTDRMTSHYYGEQGDVLRKASLKATRLIKH